MNRRNWNLIAALIVTIMFWACTPIVDSFTGGVTTREIREKWQPADGKVLRIWDTGIRVNDDPVVGFLLETHPDGMAPYKAETKELISILWIPQIQPGAVLPVRYDSKDPSRVALDIFEK